MQTFLAEHYHASVGRIDETTRAIVIVLDYLYKANVLARDQLASCKVFYSDALSRKLNFKEEYKQWKKCLDKP